MEEEEWACQACTFLNKPSDSKCEMCLTDKPAEYNSVVCTTPKEQVRNQSCTFNRLSSNSHVTRGFDLLSCSSSDESENESGPDISHPSWKNGTDAVENARKEQQTKFSSSSANMSAASAICTDLNASYKQEKQHSSSTTVDATVHNIECIQDESWNSHPTMSPVESSLIVTPSNTKQKEFLTDETADALLQTLLPDFTSLYRLNKDSDESYGRSSYIDYKAQFQSKESTTRTVKTNDMRKAMKLFTSANAQNAIKDVDIHVAQQAKALLQKMLEQRIKARSKCFNARDQKQKSKTTRKATNGAKKTRTKQKRNTSNTTKYGASSTYNRSSRQSSISNAPSQVCSMPIPPHERVKRTKRPIQTHSSSNGQPSVDGIYAGQHWSSDALSSHLHGATDTEHMNGLSVSEWEMNGSMSFRDL